MRTICAANSDWVFRPSRIPGIRLTRFPVLFTCHRHQCSNTHLHNQLSPPKPTDSKASYTLFRTIPRYDKQLESVLSKIEIAINSQMDAINDEVTGGEYNAPKLTISAFSSYEFETPKDKGTGTNHRSMIIYDLAVMQNTLLPAVEHDSIMFDSMPRPDLSNLIHVYNDQIEKQIFIAVDKISECTEEAKAIIEDTTVLKLDNNEHALFGEKWSRKERP